MRKKLLISSGIFVGIELILVHLMIKFIDGSLAPHLVLLKFSVLSMILIGERDLNLNVIF